LRLFFFLLGVLIFGSQAPAWAEAPVVCMQPLGKHDVRLLKISRAGIEHLYGFRIRLLDGKPLPLVAWYAPRKRWRAEKLLDYLDGLSGHDSGCDYMVGFTSRDISTTKDEIKDWGIFGLGTIGGPSCMVSTFRLGARKATKRKKAERTIKVVNHELGHVLGLFHHPKKGCLMEDAKGTIRTVDSEHGLLCPDSKAAIERRLKLRLPALESFDFDKVIQGAD